MVINSRILLSIATILFAAAMVVAATYAFFSDTETSANNVLAAGDVDLKIDNTSFYNGVISEATSWTETDLTTEKFFNFLDVKPNDFGEDTISLHVQTNDAWACADVTLTSNAENDRTANEIGDGDTTDDPDGGELADRINFIWWADDGDNVLESDENLLPAGPIGALDVDETATVVIADSTNNIFSNAPNDPLEGGEEGPIHYIGKAWCFGEITAAALPQSNYSGPDDPNNDGVDVAGAATSEDGGFLCNGDNETNITQTDSLTADITFTAVQSRNNPNFVCGQEVTPTNTPTPTPGDPQVACEIDDPEADIFASLVISSDQGLRKNGTAVLADRTDPNDALGAPQSSGAASDSPVVAGSFFSLGFPHANNGNTPGSIVLDMGEAFYPNPSGPDLLVYEVTGGVYPDEIVGVEAKLDIGDAWTDLGTVTRDGNVEISPLTSARYVRLTEASNIALFEDTADGYDLDAVKAFCTEVEEQIDL